MQMNIQFSSWFSERVFLRQFRSFRFILQPAKKWSAKKLHLKDSQVVV